MNILNNNRVISRGEVEMDENLELEKEEYNALEMEIIKFDSEDIITSSPGNNTPPIDPFA